MNFKCQQIGVKDVEIIHNLMVNATVLNVVMITKFDNENLIDILGVFSNYGRLKSIHRQKIL